MNLSGKWKYVEDYTHGDSIGLLTLVHTSNKLKANLVHTETPLEGNSFVVEQELEGEIDILNNRLQLTATSYKIIQSSENIHYELDSFYAQIINENLIVGTSEDKQAILGVFSFRKL